MNDREGREGQRAREKERDKQRTRTYRFPFGFPPLTVHYIVDYQAEKSDTSETCFRHHHHHKSIGSWLSPLGSVI